jgi:hypothetical protein
MIARIEHRIGRETILPSDSPNGTFSVVFEDDGDTGYFYGLDPSREVEGENPILDALHIYNAAQVVDQHAVYPIEIRWRETGHRAGLFIEGKCHAVFDFDEQRAVCRTGFPPATGGFATSHEWDETLCEGLG